MGVVSSQPPAGPGPCRPSHSTSAALGNANQCNGVPDLLVWSGSEQNQTCGRAFFLGCTGVTDMWPCSHQLFLCQQWSGTLAPVQEVPPLCAATRQASSSLHSVPLSAPRTHDLARRQATSAFVMPQRPKNWALGRPPAAT